MLPILTALFGIVLLFGIGFWLTVNNLLYICGPNEVLVFSGGTSTVNDSRVGYRIVKGGMSLRKPLFERVSRMDLTNMTVEVTVQNAYSRGGIPLTVSGVANLKVAGHQPLLHNALVRFEGSSRAEIIQIAKDTLEGNLRGVLAKLTPEEVNDDKLAFAEQLLDEAETDLAAIGLTLDQLKIQNVSDEANYLDSIGRRQTAEIQRRARTAEANNQAESVIQDAENRKAARLIEAEAQIKIAQAKTAKRIADAESMREALVAEEVGQVKAAVARAEAALRVQQARVEQVRLQLEADVLEPAKADMEAAQSNAKGVSSKIIEDGKATADVLEEMIQTWKLGDEAAREIFLMQKLQTVMATLVDTIQDVRVDRLIILPDGNSTASKSVRLVEELKAGIGVDIPDLIQQMVGEHSRPNGSEPALTTEDKNS